MGPILELSGDLFIFEVTIHALRHSKCIMLVSVRSSLLPYKVH